MTEHTFRVVLSGLVKAIHIQLPDEAVNFVVSEVFWKHYLLKLTDVFNDKLGSSWPPEDYFGKLLILNLMTLYVKNLEGFTDEPCHLTSLCLFLIIHVHFFVYLF